MKKKLSITLASGITAFVLGITPTTAFALNSNISSIAKTNNEDDQKHPHDETRIDILKIAATVLDKSEEEIIKTEKDGTHLGQQLIDANKLEEFKTTFLSEAKAKLALAVENKSITKEEADNKYSMLETKITAWDGTTSLFKDHKEKKPTEKTVPPTQPKITTE